MPPTAHRSQFGGLGKMRRDIEDPRCQRDCSDCALDGVTPEDCQQDCPGCPYFKLCPCGNRSIYEQVAQLTRDAIETARCREVSIESIRHDMLPRPPVVPYDKAVVHMMRRIVRRIGQGRPLVVAPQKGTPPVTYRLLGGLDILLAAKALGRTRVFVQIVEPSECEAKVEFYRYELRRLDLSWENQARCLLALEEMHRERHYISPSLPTLSGLSGLTLSRTRDLLHGIRLMKKHNLNDGTIPFPTLLRSIRPSYPQAIQRELIQGIINGEWTRRQAVGHATAEMRRKKTQMGERKIQKARTSLALDHHPTTAAAIPFTASPRLAAAGAR